MEHEMNARAEHHLVAQQLQVLRVDRRRPGDDAVEGGGALLPICGSRRVGAAPVGARRAGDGVPRQPVEQFGGDPLDDPPAGPVGHAVDPDHEPAGRQPAEMIVPLDQHDVGTRPSRGDCGGRTGRPAAGDQHVAIAEQRHPARRLGDRSGGPRPPLAQPPGAEHLGLEEQSPVIGGICRHGNSHSLVTRRVSL